MGKLRIKRKKKSFKPWTLWTHNVSASFIGVFLRCRRQTQMSYVEGWSSTQSFGFFEYGTMFHYVLERAYDPERLRSNPYPPTQKTLRSWLRTFDKKNRDRVIGAGIKVQEYELLMGFCELVAKHYFERYPDDFKWKWLHTEEEFNIPYTYPDGKVANLKGFVDGTIVKQRGKKTETWIFDTKTSSQIPQDLGDDLRYNFQFNLYMYRTMVEYGLEPTGLLMNVVRRPGQKQKKDETLPQLMARVEDEIIKKPDHFFHRPECNVDSQSIMQWKREQLDPIMAELRLWCDGPGKWYKPPSQMMGVKGSATYPDAPRLPTYVNPNGLVVQRRKVDLFPLIVHGNPAGFKKGSVR